jgi:hypothetical protein
MKLIEVTMLAWRAAPVEVHAHLASKVNECGEYMALHNVVVWGLAA